MAPAQSDEASPCFIGGDWGTSHLRLFLSDTSGKLLDTVEGPGALEARGNHAAILRSLCERWDARHKNLPILLCGMVGSSVGWTTAPYLPCPARPEDIAAACVRMNEGRVHIIPGLSCRNRCDAPEFMRGEETQILGTLLLEPEFASECHLICLPGTHTKWVLLQDGTVSEFFTSPVGELFSVVANHSVLVHDGTPGNWIAGGEWFEHGLRAFARYPEVPILHRLFECRSRRLSGEFTARDSAAYLSGLLIASDVRGTLHAFRNALDSLQVHLVGTPQLTALYATALGVEGISTSSVTGVAAAVAGLTRVHQLLTGESTKNEP